jgi:hypothetical protein
LTADLRRSPLGPIGSAGVSQKTASIAHRATGFRRQESFANMVVVLTGLASRAFQANNPRLAMQTALRFDGTLIGVLLALMVVATSMRHSGNKS